jgi:hypothetical protein
LILNLLRNTNIMLSITKNYGSMKNKAEHYRQNNYSAM